jgi:IS5 family transposase
MKNVSAELAAHLDGEVTTLATCWRLERADGWVRGFTDHDRDLVFDGQTYVAATGFLPSAIKSGADLSVDNLDVDGFLDDDALRAEDLTAGLFDGARIDIFLVNWADLSQGPLLLRRGWLGEVKRADNRFSAEIRGIANRLQQELTKAIFAVVAEHLAAKGELLRGGTIVDATLIAASPSTKNREGERDPEMSQSKKGNQWYFGMKAHVGVDAESGLVHTAGVTTGKVHDAKVMANLIREDDMAVYGDKGYASDEKKRAAQEAGVLWAVKEKAKPGRHLTQRQRARNRRFGKVRAKVEHVFRVLKCQFGYRKVRYRGIAKNGAQVFALLALANLYLVRGRLASA